MVGIVFPLHSCQWCRLFWWWTLREEVDEEDSDSGVQELGRRGDFGVLWELHGACRIVQRLALLKSVLLVHSGENDITGFFAHTAAESMSENMCWNFGCAEFLLMNTHQRYD